MEEERMYEDELKDLHLPFFGVPKLLPYLRPYRKRIIAMITLGVIASLIDSIFPLFNRYAIDHFVAEKTLDTVVPFVALFFVVLLTQVFINYKSLSWCGGLEMSVDRDLLNASFNHLQELSFSYFNQHNVGYIHARVMSDTSKIGELVAWRMMDIVWNLSYVVFAIVMMLILNARLALWVIVLVPIAVVLIIYFQRKLIVLNRKIREINSRITGNFNEGITGIRSIKTMVIEDTI